jgi:hypothetical protein
MGMGFDPLMRAYDSDPMVSRKFLMGIKPCPMVKNFSLLIIGSNSFGIKN